MVSTKNHSWKWHREGPHSINLSLYVKWCYTVKICCWCNTSWSMTRWNSIFVNRWYRERYFFMINVFFVDLDYKQASFIRNKVKVQTCFWFLRFWLKHTSYFFRAWVRRLRTATSFVLHVVTDVCSCWQVAMQLDLET